MLNGELQAALDTISLLKGEPRPTPHHLLAFKDSTGEQAAAAQAMDMPSNQRLAHNGSSINRDWLVHQVEDKTAVKSTTNDEREYTSHAMLVKDIHKGHSLPAVAQDEEIRRRTQENRQALLAYRASTETKASGLAHPGAVDESRQLDMVKERLKQVLTKEMQARGLQGLELDFEWTRLLSRVCPPVCLLQPADHDSPLPCATQ